jgi:hypothetical protein
MRDEFTDDAKRSIAARAGNHCSNPDCGASTSGPQEDPSKSLNVGVAAHISGAAAGGPRYDPSLSVEQRSHVNNAIWLCQTCAKLVDNDTVRFPIAVLHAWKTIAEHNALLSIGKTKLIAPQSESQRKYSEIIPWKHKLITLTQMSTGNAVMLIGPKLGTSTVNLLDCTESYVRVCPNIQDGKPYSIALSNLEICFDDAQNRLELQIRYN